MTQDLDRLRDLAFSRVLPTPPPEDFTQGDAEAALAPLTPAQRDLVQRLACRRLAFQLLYEMDAGGDPGPEWVDRTLSRVPGLGPLAAQRVRDLALGAYAARAQADDEFFALAPDWPPHRLAAVDRAILRLAHHEMTAGLTPPRVAVNEAVELAKRYSTEKSPAFINGLLDRVLHRLAPSEAPPEAPPADPGRTP